MGRLARTVRKTAKQGSLFPATVLDAGAGKATVRLSNNGAIYRMLNITGGPVVKGQKVHVDFTTPNPTVVAPAPDVIGEISIRSRIRLPVQRPKSIAEGIILLEPNGQQTGYPVSGEGLVDCLDDAYEGCKVLIPNCDISGSSAAPSGFVVPTDVDVIGASREGTIVNGSWNLDDEVSLTTLNLRNHIDSGSPSVIVVNGPISIGELATIYDCIIYASTCGTGNATGIVMNDGSLSCARLDVAGEANSGSGFAASGDSSGSLTIRDSEIYGSTAQYYNDTNIFVYGTVEGAPILECGDSYVGPTMTQRNWSLHTASTILNRKNEPDNYITSGSFYNDFYEGGSDVAEKRHYISESSGTYYWFLDSGNAYYPNRYGICRMLWNSTLSQDCYTRDLASTSGSSPSNKDESTMYFAMASGSLGFSYHLNATSGSHMYFTKYSGGLDLPTRTVVTDFNIVRSQSGKSILSETMEGVFTTVVDGDVRVMWISWAQWQSIPVRASLHVVVYSDGQSSILSDSVLDFGGDSVDTYEGGGFYKNKYVMMLAVGYGTGTGKHYDTVALIIDMSTGATSTYTYPKTGTFAYPSSLGLDYGVGRLYFVMSDYNASSDLIAKKLVYFDLENYNFYDAGIDLFDTANKNPMHFVVGKETAYFLLRQYVTSAWRIRIIDPRSGTVLIDVADGDSKQNEWCSQFDDINQRVWRWNNTLGRLQGYKLDGSYVLVYIDDHSSDHGPNPQWIFTLFNNRFFIQIHIFGDTIPDIYRIMP